MSGCGPRHWGHAWRTRTQARDWPTLQWRHNGCDGVSNHQPHDCLLNRLFRSRSKKTSNFRVTGLCGGNSTVTGEFSAQRASNTENVFIWWRHHDISRLFHDLLRRATKKTSKLHINTLCDRNPPVNFTKLKEESFWALHTTGWLHKAKRVIVFGTAYKTQI